MLEVKKDHLHQDEDEDALDQERRRHAEVKGEDAKQDRCQNRRSEVLPAKTARLETLELGQSHRTPPDEPAGSSADNGPSRSQKQ